MYYGRSLFTVLTHRLNNFMYEVVINANIELRNYLKDLTNVISEFLGRTGFDGMY
jgi:hypothetical protein